MDRQQQGTEGRDSQPGDDDATRETEAQSLWDEMQAEDKAKQPHADHDHDHDDGAEAPGDAERKAQSEDAEAAADQADDTTKAKDKDDAGAQQQAPDPWANASEEQRSAWQEAQQELENLRNYRRSNDGRIAAYQRQVAQLQRQAQQKPPETAASQQADATKASEAKGAATAILESDEWKALSDEYPEIATPLQKALAQMADQLGGMNQRLQTVDDDRQQAALAHETNRLNEAIPDWLPTLQSNWDRFEEWIDTQPRHIREAFERNREVVQDADEAADVVIRFKSTLQPPQQQTTSAPANGAQQQQPSMPDKRQRQLRSSGTAKSRPLSATTAIPEDDPQAIWDAYGRMGI